MADGIEYLQQILTERELLAAKSHGHKVHLSKHMQIINEYHHLKHGWQLN